MGYVAIDADALNSLAYAGLAENAPTKYLDALLAFVHSQGDMLVVTDMIEEESSGGRKFAKDMAVGSWLVGMRAAPQMLQPVTATFENRKIGDEVPNPGEESITDFKFRVGEPVVVISDDKKFWNATDAVWYSTRGILARIVASGHIAKEDAAAAISYLHNAKRRAKTLSPYDPPETAELVAAPLPPVPSGRA
jgi:hypothetical protein